MTTPRPSPLLRRLFALFPRDHREEFAAEMWEVVCYRHGQLRTGAGRDVWFTLAAATDIVWSALRVRGSRMRRWVMSGWRGFGTDVRFLLRGLRRARGFTVTALAVLAVAVSVNTAVFAFVSGTLLERPPYENPRELVFAWGSNPVLFQNSAEREALH